MVKVLECFQCLLVVMQKVNLVWILMFRTGNGSVNHDMLKETGSIQGFLV